MEHILLANERMVAAVRRHRAQLFEPVLSVLAGLVVLGWLDHVLPLRPLIMRALLLAAWLGLAARLVWKLLEWREDWFVVTDRRLLIRQGVITRRVSMMPLIKVTDLRFTRPPVGRLLGYGEMIIESAGQKQALRNVRHLPDPDGLYLVICGVLFEPTP